MTTTDEACINNMDMISPSGRLIMNRLLEGASIFFIRFRAFAEVKLVQKYNSIPMSDIYEQFIVFAYGTFLQKVTFC